MRKNPVVKIVILLAISAMAVLVWYSPIIFKGYSGVLPNSHMVIAKNIALTGKYSAENEKNVILSSERITTEGVTSSHGDKLIPIASGYIYRTLGLPNAEKAALISVVISALALFFFALTVREKFGFLAAVIFSGIYMFLPAVWTTSINPNFMEYSLLFLSIGLFFLFSEKTKILKLKFILAGLFLALSFLSRDSMAVLAPTLLVWLWLYNRKAIIPLFGSLVLTLILFTVIFQQVYGASSNYHFSYFKSGGEAAKARDFTFYGHLYPDPYTYHYARESYLEEKIKATADLSALEKLGLNKNLANVESGEVGIISRLAVAPLLLLKHLSHLLTLVYVGGPLVIMFGFLGFLWLIKIKKDKPMAYFSALWTSTAILFFSFIAAVQRSHVMDYAFIIALFASLGAIFLSASLIKEFFPGHKILNNRNISLLIALVLVYQLVLSAHVSLSTGYDQSTTLKLQAYTDKIKEAKLNATDIIALPLDNGAIYALNFYSDKSIIKFDDKTIEKLIAEDKLNYAFKEFGVTKILGFSASTTEEISRNTTLYNIADNNLRTNPIVMSSLKSLLLNLIK